MCGLASNRHKRPLDRLCGLKGTLTASPHPAEVQRLKTPPDLSCIYSTQKGLEGLEACWGGGGAGSSSLRSGAET